MASNPLPKWAIAVFALAALIGFADTAYLTAEHFRGIIPPCSVVQGCEIVLTSEYAVIAGIPLAMVGMAYYGALLVLIIAFIDRGSQRIMRLASWLAVSGFFVSLYLIYLQAFVLDAFCQYCLVSAGTSVVLLIGGIRILRNR